MQKLVFLVLFFALHNKVAYCQALQGKVLSISNEPIAGASVFLSNTSTGTVSDGEGNFVIQKFPQGRFDLIVSSIGFETFTQSVQSGLLPQSLIIKLTPKAKELEAVILETYVKDGWKKWGLFFLENFVGTTPFSKECVIKNKEVIKFKKTPTTLTAIAMAPLVIENKAMGYIVEYQLEEFKYDFNTHFIFYYGYPLFKEMQTRRNKQKKRWNSNREEAYYGSLLHFMRSLFRNQLLQDGFEVRRLYKRPNLEKQRVKAVVQRNAFKQSAPVNTNNSTTFDSTAFYNNILHQPDEISYLVKTVIPGDSIAFAIDSFTAGLQFTDHLDITYTKKKESLSYIRNSTRAPGNPVSQLTLLDAEHIEVLSNGSYFNPTDMLTWGYWSWSEKVSTMLPFDYNPVNKKGTQ